MTFSIIAFPLNASYAISWQDIFIRGVQVIQLSTLSDQQEMQIGKEIRQELINSGRIKLYQNRRLNRYLNQIGSTLVKNSDRPQLKYQFSLVDSEEINAFATMGGFVYIHTGLMKLAENEAQLASVVGHEIGHITGRHSLKQMRAAAIREGILTATGLDERQAVQIGVTLALDLPHSRQHEYQADELGLAMLTKAGYAPGAMVDFMKKLQAQSSNIPSILSTHPASKDRVLALVEQISPQTAYQGIGLNDRSYQKNIRELF
jgi:predicted Zn-dependent protease